VIFWDTWFPSDAVHTVGLRPNSCLGIVVFVGTWFKINSDIMDIFLLWCLPTYNFLFICTLWLDISTAAYSVTAALVHYSTRSDVTVHNWAYVDTALFTFDDSNITRLILAHIIRNIVYTCVTVRLVMTVPFSAKGWILNWYYFCVLFTSWIYCWCIRFSSAKVLGHELNFLKVSLVYYTKFYT
jgi:hypothetical protein